MSFAGASSQSYYDNKPNEAKAAADAAAIEARRKALETTPLPGGTSTSAAPGGTPPPTSSNRASAVLTGQGQGLLDSPNNNARRVLLGS